MSENDNDNNKSSGTSRFSPIQLALIVLSLAVVGFVLYRAFAASPSTKTNNPVNNNQNNQAVSEATSKLYLTPANQELAANAQITIEVREDSGNIPINAVQADFSYPADRLTFVSIDYTGSAFDVKAQESAGNGQIVIARGNVSSRTGDQLIAKVTFQTSSGPTTAELKFQNSSQLINASTNKNTLSLDSSKGATYTIR